jgi:hypothetical protein
LTIDPAELAAQSLKGQFDQQVGSGTFPCVDGLRELRDSAARCRISSFGDHGVVAFILEKIFGGWAYDLDERPVSKTETDALRQTLLTPVTRAIEFLNGEAGDPLRVAADLVRVAP